VKGLGCGKYWTVAGNVTWGCTPASEACLNCYAKRQHDRYHDAGVNRAASVPGLYRAPFEQVQMRPKVMDDFAKWKNEVVFVDNMSDLFEPRVPFEYIGEVFQTIYKNPQNTYLILTKRAYRMKSFFEWFSARYGLLDIPHKPFTELFPNVWLGVTAENQQRADERIPLLLDTPAAHRWVSVEPMLGPIEFDCWNCDGKEDGCIRTGCDHPFEHDAKLDLVIAGGESGAGARPTRGEWFESLYNQCHAAGVRYVHKQSGDAYMDNPVSYTVDPEAFRQPFVGRGVA
jgi:protein gp37